MPARSVNTIIWISIHRAEYVLFDRIHCYAPLNLASCVLGLHF